jgi:D-arabinose 5-phosphate isomerase GutQ
VEEMCPLTQAPITSTLTSLALCQLLVAATVESRNYPIEQYAKNHPGGKGPVKNRPAGKKIMKT